MIQPAIPFGGVAGYRFLQRTMDRQMEAFANDPALSRDIAYFTENVAKADTAEKLVADRRLLRVALGAFGLGDEIGKGAFVRKALAEGTEAEDAFANKIADPKYRDLAAAFGFGNAGGAPVDDPAFVADIVARFRVRQFENAVGEADVNMRLALNFEREMTRLAASGLEESTVRLRVLGDNALRAVMEGAFGLPGEFAALDIDRQSEVIAERARDIVGSGGLKALTDPDLRDQMIRRFFARAQLTQGPGPNAPGMAALTILQGGVGPGAIENLLASRF